MPKKKNLKEPHLQTHRIQQKGDRKIQNLHLGLVKKKNFEKKKKFSLKS